MGKREFEQRKHKQDVGIKGEIKNGGRQEDSKSKN